MSRGQHINLVEAREMLRLGKRMHAAPDTATRKILLLEGLCQLVHAGAATCIVTQTDRRSRKPTILSFVETECEPLHKEVGEKAEPSFGTRKHLTLPPTSRRRRSRAPQRTPEARVNYLQSDLALGQNDITASVQFRREGARFSAYDRKLVELVHEEMGWIYETDVLVTSPKTDGLSARQRQTLERLLSGDSEKQIAAKLKLSPNTIHHYVKGIYRHYAVNTRSELLARVFGGQARDRINAVGTITPLSP